MVEREICIMDVQPTNLQQLRDAIMSIWTKISEECFQHLVESMPRRIKAVLKAKGGPTHTSKVYLIQWPMSVNMYTKLREKLFCRKVRISWDVFGTCYSPAHFIFYWNEEMSAGLAQRTLVFSLLWQSWGAQPEALEAPGNPRSRGVGPTGSIHNPALLMLFQICMTFFLQWNTQGVVLNNVFPHTMKSYCDHELGSFKKGQKHYKISLYSWYWHCFFIYIKKRSVTKEQLC